MDTIAVASGLSRPVFVTAPPGDYNRIFIVEQQVTINNQLNGRIHVLAPARHHSVIPEVALRRLYPGGKSEYLERFTESLDATIRAGFLVRADRSEILELAAATY